MKHLILAISILAISGCSKSNDQSPGSNNPNTNFNSGIIYGNKVTWKVNITGNYDEARFSCSNTPDSTQFYYAGTSSPIPSVYEYSFQVPSESVNLNASVFTGLNGQVPKTTVTISLYIDDKFVYSQSGQGNLGWRIKDLPNIANGGVHLYPVWVKKP